MGKTEVLSPWKSGRYGSWLRCRPGANPSWVNPTAKQEYNEDDTFDSRRVQLHGGLRTDVGRRRWQCRRWEHWWGHDGWWILWLEWCRGGPEFRLSCGEHGWQPTEPVPIRNRCRGGRPIRNGCGVRLDETRVARLPSEPRIARVAHRPGASGFAG
ncbi:hypothetical protein SDC9_131723 [bioreactor metagenome]|uniref:Uncharacterized protein n=1 Tax=bioreactor metagenome TaxID=1076179 RepID=A0A645D577_9ZZZZ